MPSGWLATWLDAEHLIANGAVILPALRPGDELPPIRAGPEIAAELTGRHLLHYLTEDNRERYNHGRDTDCYVTPTAFSTEEVNDWLILPGSRKPRPYVLILNPALIAEILGSGSEVGRKLAVAAELTTEDFVSTIDRTFEEYARAHGLRIIASHIDNHGGLQWQAGHVGELTRYLTIGLMLDAAQRPEDLEIWVGADNGRKHARRVWLEWTAGDPCRLTLEGRLGAFMLAANPQDPMTGFRALLQKLPQELENAWKLGEMKLNEQDLSEEYVVR